jgi:hypothetical protein
MTAIEQRQALVASATHHEQEVQRALADLKSAVHEKLTLAEHLRTHIATHPGSWLVSGLLVGMWLGRRK